MGHSTREAAAVYPVAVAFRAMVMMDVHHRFASNLVIIAVLGRNKQALYMFEGTGERSGQRSRRLNNLPVRRQHEDGRSHLTNKIRLAKTFSPRRSILPLNPNEIE